MPVDYKKIRQFNKDRYGWDIRRIGQQIFADTYADRTHFIFELLQNAEDAIARRAPDWEGSRTVSFDLTENLLRVSHFGEPFNDDDVRGICGIAESTKELTDIGRFGIGFKSVYAFTDRPRIHSGGEDFAIESFVWPTAVLPIDRDPDETVILIPLDSSDSSNHDEIASGLRGLGTQTLLFLRQIREIRWSIQEVDSGQYLREEATIDGDASNGVRRVTVIGQASEQRGVDENDWLVFSRCVDKDGDDAGCVEIAFSLDITGDGNEIVNPISESPLVVFFPTVLETRLGFLLQGPFQTTPSRDNIPQFKPWNLHLVSESAILLKNALRWLRNHNRLDTNVLCCLPIGTANFNMGMFDALFKATRDSLASETLLPRLGGGYTSASSAFLGRSAALRQLFSEDQLRLLYTAKCNPSWLSSDITADRAPRLRNYLMNVLDVEELTPAAIIRKCDSAFFEAQSDSWMEQLYEVLGDIPSLLRPQSGYRFPYNTNHQLYNVPLIRLENGRHITAELDGRVQAYLPTAATTEFRTICANTCTTTEAREFLSRLGLREPDPIDDVMENILPRYEKLSNDVSLDKYESDICRIVSAYSDCDSSKQRQRLVDHLRPLPFVMAADSAGRGKSRAKPGEVYLGTDSLLSLFSGVAGVRFVDGDVDCLKDDEIQGLLQRCGAAMHLRPVQFTTRLFKSYPDVKRQYSTRGEHIEDCYLYGLDLLLEALPLFEANERVQRAAQLWEALSELGREHFSGSYHWFYYSPQSTSFDAKFVKLLNQAKWVPDSDGDLHSPASVFFDDLGLQKNPYLQSKILFKPPALDEESARVLRLMGIANDVVENLKRLPPDEISELLRSALQRKVKDNVGRRRRDSGETSETTDEGSNGQVDAPVERFSDHLVHSMTPDPPHASYKEAILPTVGPSTIESAVRDTIESIEKGRVGSLEVRESRRFVLSKEANEISQKVRECCTVTMGGAVRFVDPHS